MSTDFSEKKEELFELYEKILNLNSSLPCNKNGCTTGCEPGFSDCELILLPFEKEFIESHLKDSLKFTSTDVPNESPSIMTHSMDNRCPYFNSNCRCDLYTVRPIDCRVCPVVPTKVSGQLSFFIYEGCSIPHDDIELRAHVATWMDIFKALDPYLSDEWWKIYDVFPCPDKKILTTVDEVIEEYHKNRRKK